MKYFLFFVLLLIVQIGIAQTLIHSHNDYEKPAPLVTALDNKAYNVEADVYLENGQLLVAHERKEIKPERTLSALYILPIVELFRKNKGSISADKSYRTNLVIDIKEKGTEVIKQLIEDIKPYQQYFDRSTNANAVQIVLSGDRTSVDKWTTYPKFIFFDGRPNEFYSEQTLSKVAFISDSYAKYIDKQNPSKMDSVEAAVRKVHALKKPIRFWGSPDNRETWVKLIGLEVDILNTDKVKECREFLNSTK